MWAGSPSFIHGSLISVLKDVAPCTSNNDRYPSSVLSRTDWKWDSAAEHPRPDLQCWATLSILCASQTYVILLRISLSHSFFRQSNMLSGRRSFAVGVPLLIFGFCQSSIQRVYEIFCSAVGKHLIETSVSAWNVL